MAEITAAEIAAERGAEMARRRGEAAAARVTMWRREAERRRAWARDLAHMRAEAEGWAQNCAYRDSCPSDRAEAAAWEIVRSIRAAEALAIAEERLAEEEARGAAAAASAYGAPLDTAAEMP